MPVSHAPETTVTSENRDEKKVPGLLEMLAQVPDLRKRRGRRYELVFVLAVAACCALAGAKTFRFQSRPARIKRHRNRPL